ncbi:MAG TPA: hypothetical protein VGX23_02030 [Actinocrinis sp.]|nr:hypothetical protein [Actinocrinis sp.]
MSQDIDRLRAELEKVFDEPPPPTTVDAARLLERGHRRQRRRRGAGALSAVATVAVAVLVATSLPGLAARPNPVATGGGTRMLSPGRFGWLPKAPDAYRYQVDQNISTVTAEWADQPADQGPELTLSALDVDRSLPPITLLGAAHQDAPSPESSVIALQTYSTSTAPPESTDSGATPDATMLPLITYSQVPVQVGTIDGNPVWYYPLSGQFPDSGPLVDFLAWKTASGQWAALQDPQADGPTLLRIAKAANTKPTPLAVPLMPTGSLAGLSVYNVLLVQKPDNSGMEYALYGTLGKENVSVLGFAGDTGITSQGGTNCDFEDVSGHGLYQPTCAQELPQLIPGAPFHPSPGPTGSTQTSMPTRTPTGQASTDTGFIVQAAQKLLNGIRVYVMVDVNMQFNPALSDQALTEVTSFGPNPADWQPTDFGR